MTKEKIKRKVGRPSNAELKRRKDEAEKDKILWFLMLVGVALCIGVLAQNVLADQMTHKFKSPSFSGENTSSHYLTIDNVEYTRKMSIKAELGSILLENIRLNSKSSTDDIRDLVSSSI